MVNKWIEEVEEETDLRELWKMAFMNKAEKEQYAFHKFLERNLD